MEYIPVLVKQDPYLYGPIDSAFLPLHEQIMLTVLKQYSCLFSLAIAHNETPHITARPDFRIIPQQRSLLALNPVHCTQH